MHFIISADIDFIIYIYRLKCIEACPTPLFVQLLSSYLLPFIRRENADAIGIQSRREYYFGSHIL